MATLLALWLSLIAELDSPRTAMFCVLLVMQPRNGMVFNKSYFRLLGTVAGAVVSVILLAIFDQNPTGFFIGFAIWVACCTIGAQALRDFQSYGYVLAGYTVCFVALPAIDHPDQVLAIAMTRVAEIFVGIFCAAVVSDTLWPQPSDDALRTLLTQRRDALLGWLDQAPAQLRRGLDDTSDHQMMTVFAADILALQSRHHDTRFESSDLRRQRQQLLKLNHGLMQLTTTLHTLHQTIRRIVDQGSAQVAQALLAYYETMTATLSAASRCDSIDAALAAWRDETASQWRAIKSDLGAGLDAATRRDLDTGEALFGRLQDALQTYLQAHCALLSPNGRTAATVDASRVEWSFSTRVDPLLAAAAAVRGVGVLAVTALVWLGGGGAVGVGPIALGVSSGTIFSALPSPAAVVRQALAGWMLAMPVGLIWNFVLLPTVNDWIGLSLLLLVPLMVIGLLLARANTQVFGTGMAIAFMLHVGIDHRFSGDGQQYLNEWGGDLIGFVTAWAFYRAIHLHGSAWARRRIVSRLRQQLVDLCVGRRPSHAELELSCRDRLQRIASRDRGADAIDDWALDWTLTALEVGAAIIAIRAAQDGADPTRIRRRLHQALQRLARLFERPSALARRAAAQAVERALVALSGPPGRALPHGAHQQLTLQCALLRSVLMMPASVLDQREP